MAVTTTTHIDTRLLYQWIHDDIRNLHVEVVRQAFVTQEQMEQRHQEMQQEIKSLREELAKLRKQQQKQ
jgi:hypothetical protein